MEGEELKTTPSWSFVAKRNKEMGQQLARKVGIKVFTMRKNSMFVYCAYICT